MSSGERPIGAAKGKQSDTEALCQTPPSKAPRMCPAGVFLMANASFDGNVTDSNLPQRLCRPPPTACPIASEAAAEVPSQKRHPCPPPLHSPCLCSTGPWPPPLTLNSACQPAQPPDRGSGPHRIPSAYESEHTPAASHDTFRGSTAGPFPALRPRAAAVVQSSRRRPAARGSWSRGQSTGTSLYLDVPYGSARMDRDMGWGARAFNFGPQLVRCGPAT